MEIPGRVIERLTSPKEENSVLIKRSKKELIHIQGNSGRNSGLKK